jgi:TPR repeat protein
MSKFSLTFLSLTVGLTALSFAQSPAVPAPAATEKGTQAAAQGAPQTGPLATLRKKADAGDTASQIKLGDMYSLGSDGVVRNLAEAVKWYKKAADSGNSDAQTKMGMMLEGGFGTPKDPKQAMEYLDKAAQQGNTAAQMRLASAYEMGRNVDKNAKKAIEYYEKAANAGVAKAQVKLGDIYRDGLEEVPHDYQKSLEWYHKAADQKSPDGEYRIGFMYEQGFGVTANMDEAISWDKKSASQGYTEAKVALSILGIRSGY